MFEVLDVSIEMAGEMRGIVDRVQRRSAPLADQMRRAAESVALNFGEARWRTGRDRVLRYRYAAGSAEEVRAAIRMAVAWGYVSEGDANRATVLVDRVLAMSWRLIHPRKRA